MSPILAAPSTCTGQRSIYPSLAAQSSGKKSMHPIFAAPSSDGCVGYTYLCVHMECSTNTYAKVTGFIQFSHSTHRLLMKDEICQI